MALSRICGLLERSGFHGQRDAQLVDRILEANGFYALNSKRHAKHHYPLKS